MNHILLISLTVLSDELRRAKEERKQREDTQLQAGQSIKASANFEIVPKPTASSSAASSVLSPGTQTPVTTSSSVSISADTLENCTSAEEID